MNTLDLASIHEFANLAKAFCAWCESDSLGPEPDRRAASWLALLYAGALKLPQVEPESDEVNPHISSPADETVVQNFRQFWGQAYRQVFDPRLQSEEAPVVADLGDDLTDIYNDIKRTLLLYERGKVIDAAWQWRFDHETHWGHHAVGALYGIHHLTVSGLG